MGLEPPTPRSNVLLLRLSQPGAPGFLVSCVLCICLWPGRGEPGRPGHLGGPRTGPAAQLVLREFLPGLDGWTNGRTDPCLHPLVSLSVSVCLSPLLPLPPFPPAQVSPRQGPGSPVPQGGCGTGKRAGFVAWLEWGPTGPGLTPPFVPSPQPQGPRGAGLRSLRAAPGRTHLAGEAPSLPAAHCCHLAATSGEQHPFLQHPSQRGPPFRGPPDPLPLPTPRLIHPRWRSSF